MLRVHAVLCVYHVSPYSTRVLYVLFQYIDRRPVWVYRIHSVTLDLYTGPKNLFVVDSVLDIAYIIFTVLLMCVVMFFYVVLIVFSNYLCIRLGYQLAIVKKYYKRIRHLFYRLVVRPLPPIVVTEIIIKMRFIMECIHLCCTVLRNFRGSWTTNLNVCLMWKINIYLYMISVIVFP